MALFYRLKKLSVLLKAVIGLVLVAGLGLPSCPVPHPDQIFGGWHKFSGGKL